MDDSLDEFAKELQEEIEKLKAENKRLQEENEDLKKGREKNEEDPDDPFYTMPGGGVCRKDGYWRCGG